MIFRKKKRLFAAMLFVFITASMFALCTILVEKMVLEKGGIMALNNELFLTLPPEMNTNLPYDHCCMPKEVLSDKERTFSVLVDRQGRRIAQESEEGGRVLLLLGDSSMYGQSLSQGETIGDHLAEFSKAAGNPLQISNRAVPGSNSILADVHARALIPVEKPDAVVLCVGVNDATLVPDFVARYYRRAADQLVKEKLPSFFVVGEFFAKFAIRFPLSKVFGARETPMVSAESFHSNLQRIVETVSKSGAVTVLISDVRVEPDSNINEEYTLAFESIAEGKGIVWMNLPEIARQSEALIRNDPFFKTERERIKRTYRSDLLEQGSPYWATTDGGHPNPALSMIIAEKILQALASLSPNRFVPPIVPWTVD